MNCPTCGSGFDVIRTVPSATVDYRMVACRNPECGYRAVQEIHLAEDMEAAKRNLKIAEAANYQRRHLTISITGNGKVLLPS